MGFPIEPKGLPSVPIGNYHCLFEAWSLEKKISRIQPQNPCHPCTWWRCWQRHFPENKINSRQGRPLRMTLLWGYSQLLLVPQTSVAIDDTKPRVILFASGTATAFLLDTVTFLVFLLPWEKIVSSCQVVRVEGKLKIWCFMPYHHFVIGGLGL